jgi:hypothetical protein
VHQNRSSCPRPWRESPGLYELDTSPWISSGFYEHCPFVILTLITAPSSSPPLPPLRLNHSHFSSHRAYASVRYGAPLWVPLLDVPPPPPEPEKSSEAKDLKSADGSSKGGAATATATGAARCPSLNSIWRIDVIVCCLHLPSPHVWM